MQKGFGLYSTHETTIFFLKLMLVSFWAGIDLIAILVITAFPISVLADHSLLVIGTMAILIAGTVFSLLFTWATGSLFGRQVAQPAVGPVRDALQRLKRQPYHLVGVGAGSVALLLMIAVYQFITLQRESELIGTIGRRADAIIVKKCAEVASLEKQLFQSDEQLVLTQCLIQYDKAFAIRAAEGRP